ncbi:MAG: DNA methylase, partial [Planctomycetes bacterium]|nr:DNA methylase [Planctomycetota bacterium]
MTSTPKFIQESALHYETQQESPEEAKKGAEYRQRLVEKLKDPEFRKIEGFPLGTDEDILALSDPPYYTACPNPFLAEILEGWQAERRATRNDLNLPDDENPPEGFRLYRREPFATDVSEGKNDPIYNAHSYHTKVPHRAIMRYILHYTDPGDIVFDGFCGTGMTGVAAQLCGDKKTVESLGYLVDQKGIIYDGEKAISRLGARMAVLNDLSPAATFIAYNYNTPVDARTFEREAKRILGEVEKECGWMYETWHPHAADPQRVKGRINYTVWSDIFGCPQCGKEMVFWDVAVEPEAGSIRESWKCPACGTLLAKVLKKDSGAQIVQRVMDTIFDRALGETLRQPRQAPVLINYSVGKKRHEKRPDEEDFALIRQIEETEIPYVFPIEPMMFKGKMWGDTWRAGYHAGLTHMHHFYTRRNLWVLAAFWGKAKTSGIKNKISWVNTGIDTISSKLLNFRVSGSGKPTPLKGTLYLSSLYPELNPHNMFFNKYHLRIAPICDQVKGSVVSVTQSASLIEKTVPNTFDYIFIDPPFGGNLMYSELNFIWETWLKVFTNNHSEAIMSKEQKKGLGEYQRLMEVCFREFQRLLKPGRWMTIEFHNSQNAVWNAIQEALLQAGFMMADVRTLDK